MGKVKNYIIEYFSKNPMNEKVITLNLQRVYMMAWLILLVQVANLWDPRMYQYPTLFIGELCMIFISLLYLATTSYLRRKSYEGISYKAQRGIYYSYWIFLMVALVPFYVSDYISIKQPLNPLLYCCLVIAVPVLTRKELLLLLTTHTIIVCTTVCLTHAGTSNFVYGLVMNFAAFIISGSVQNSHIKLEIDAETDFLTKLPNRRLGQGQIKNLWKKCQRHKTMCCTLIVDIDFFKDYNDTFGHFVGDVALIEVARCIRSEAKRPSDIVYRLGGEEFMLSIESDSADEIIEIARRIREKVEGLHIDGARKDVSEYLTVSIGIAAKIPEGSETEHMLLYEADSNLYVAKAMGRNKIAFEEKII